MKPISGALVWTLHATHGLPFEISIPMLAERGLVPTWHDVLCAASKDGCQWTVLIPRLQDAAMDSYPQDYARVVCERLQAILDSILLS